MKRFFSRLVVRAVLAGLVLSIFVVQGWFGALLGWMVTAYLVWRAFPAVRKDFRSLWNVGSRTATARMARF